MTSLPLTQPGVTRSGPSPLSQTFSVTDIEFPQGMFVSSCDIYFYSKDLFAPVTLDIRRVALGLPTYEIIAGSQVVLIPSQVETSLEGNVATKFTFDVPVYLEPGEYAISLSTNSNKYRVFVAKEFYRQIQRELVRKVVVVFHVKSWKYLPVTNAQARYVLQRGLAQHGRPPCVN